MRVDGHVSRLLKDSIAPFLFVTCVIAAETLLLYYFRRQFDPWQLSLFYLPAIIGCAVRYGVAVNAWGAVFCFCCWLGVLLGPDQRRILHDSISVDTLLAYLSVGLTISILASRVKQKSLEADARSGEAKMLYMVSQVVGREIDAEQLLRTLAEEVVRLCQASECAILRTRTSIDGVVMVTLAGDKSPSETRISVIERNAYNVLLEQAESLNFKQWTTGDSITRPLVAPSRLSGDAGGLYLPLQVDGITLGLIYAGYRTDGEQFSFQDERIIVTLASQAAVVMARDRLTEVATNQAQRVAILGERNRLAKEVHDTLSHAFTGIRFLLEAAEVSNKDELPEIISQARQMAIDGAQEARRSVWALRPVALEEGGGIVKAIRSLIKQQTDRTSIASLLNVSGEERLVASDQEDNLLRICQEALTNIIRHSNATEIVVTINFGSDNLTLNITDDGCGFSEDSISYGFGINNMMERTVMIGGAFKVNSKPGSGTAIIATVPIKSNQLL